MGNYGSVFNVVCAADFEITRNTTYRSTRARDGKKMYDNPLRDSTFVTTVRPNCLSCFFNFSKCNNLHARGIFQDEFLEIERSVSPPLSSHLKRMIFTVPLRARPDQFQFSVLNFVYHLDFDAKPLRIFFATCTLIYSIISRSSLSYRINLFHVR